MWTILAVLGCGGPAQEPISKTLTYPETRRVEVVDEIHGEKVPDPYRWLEDPDSEGYDEWIAAQNELTDAWLGEIPERAAIKDRLETLWAYESYGVPRKHGDLYFFEHRAVGADQPVLKVSDSLEGEGRVLLDVTSTDATNSLASWSVSKDGAYVAYGVSDGGSDWRTFKVREVATGTDLADEVKWVKFSTAAWAPDGSGFWYSRYPAPKAELEDANRNHKLYFHRLNTTQSDDVLVFETPDHPQRGFDAETTANGDYLVITVWEGTEEKSRVYYQCLRPRPECVDPQPASDGVYAGKAGVRRFLDDFDANYAVLDVHNDGFLIYTNHNAPRGRIIWVPLSDASEPAWQTVVAQSESETLDGAAVIGGRLVLSYLKDARSVVRIHALDGTLQQEVKTPGLGTVGGFRGPQPDAQTFFWFTSFTTPRSIYALDVTTGGVTPHRRPTVDFDPADFVTEQVFYESGDGTRIPMFLTHMRGRVQHGETPTLLYGYGGFNIPITPGFKADRIVWMERGGLYASANLRGGGEYGQDWHLSGTRQRKQNVFDDFAAAAEYLHGAGWTRPGLTAIQGRSNGGLLVGATLLQRPELFGAAQPGVGVLDMLRYHKFTIGWAWASDYGTADDPEDFPALLAYSPVHNAKAGVTYPATLITTADRDDRVVPLHSFKFAAAMQHAQAGTAPTEAPTLIRIDTRAGHGAGKSVSMQIEEAADILAFFERALK